MSSLLLVTAAILLISSIKRPGHFGALFLFGYPIAQLCGVPFSAPFSALAVSMLILMHLAKDHRTFRHLHISIVDKTVAILAITILISALFAPSTAVSFPSYISLMSQLGAGYLIFRLSFSLAPLDKTSREFLIACSILSATTSIVFIGSGQATSWGRFKLEDGSNISVGITQALGTAAIATIYLISACPIRRIFSILLLSTSLALSVYAINLTGTRGSLLAITAGSLFIIIKLTSSRKMLRKLTITVVTASVAVFIYSQVNDIDLFAGRLFKFESYGSIYDTSSMERIYRIRNALDIIDSNIILGVGPGGFDYLTDQDYPHNIFLDIATTGGLLSMAAFLFLIIITVSTCAKKNILKARDHFVGVMALLFATFIHYQVSFSLEHGKPLMLIATIAAATSITNKGRVIAPGVKKFSGGNSGVRPA
ncbi:O-antigen ligase family protein [Pseudomonas sp. GX19020]|uniref:O-antigen ligase family protein n=1 Tax=Pseudomonas sp. GX19020 TaxID=2942277 RepID=UPI0020188758|nr:O-antigen ligase family protein [Pseudomonas sp. GX19020]MCL4069290.1 O-antigen ligase family protein [Pseudomonas sp. GX19020]